MPEISQIFCRFRYSNRQFAKWLGAIGQTRKKNVRFWVFVYRNDNQIICRKSVKLVYYRKLFIFITTCYNKMNFYVISNYTGVFILLLHLKRFVERLVVSLASAHRKVAGQSSKYADYFHYIGHLVPIRELTKLLTLVVLCEFTCLSFNSVNNESCRCSRNYRFGFRPPISSPPTK